MLKTAIFILIILAFLLRIIFIFSGGVSFHYDMARDAYEAKQIWQQGHLKILGPPTSTPGLFHGVFYYYLLAPFYMIAQGNPETVALFFAFINSLSVIPIVLLARDFLKSDKWAILAGIFFVFSFEGTQYGSWLSNPSPAALTVPLFFLFLRLWQKGKTYGLYLAVLLGTLSTQFQFFLIYLFFLIPIFAIIFKVKTNKKSIGVSLLIAFFGLSTFFISAIKFDTLNQIFSGLLNIGVAAPIDFRPQFAEVFLNYINRFAELFTLNFFPTNVFLGGLLAILAIYAVRKEKFILFLLLSNLLIFIFGGHSNTYVNVGLAAPAILSVLLFLKQINKRIVYVFIFLSLISNLFAILRYNPQGQIILVIPNDMNLKNELSLIDKTYAIAEGKPFSINTVTLPLWTNTTWAYLYSWYGQKKYGYVPFFYGHDQVGLLGVDSLKKIDKPLEKTFLIIEPTEGIPQTFYQQELDTENAKTKFVSEIDYSSLKLQVRIPKNEQK